MSLLHSGKIKPLFINITVIKELSQFYLQIWEPSSENKGLKQAQDRSVEMTVNKPPSWVKHMLKKKFAWLPSINDRCQMICSE